jgi:beta-galactosidase/beta-glucuronidase
MAIPRPEYPRPQFQRDDWLCLNGEWQFEFDPGDSGRERGLVEKPLSSTIVVPFCPESELSGIGDVDFHAAAWYRRDVTLPAEWSGRRALLWFQAVDYDATVWANGVEVARHRGGFTPFAADLDGVAGPGETVTIVVRARDNARSPRPRGKQCHTYANHGCLYTRTTGLWQTVWLEPVPEVRLRRPRLAPDVAGRRFILTQPLSSNPPGWRVRATLSDATGRVTVAETPADGGLMPQLDLVVPEDRVRLWRPGRPELYDVLIELIDAGGTVVDRARSYAGLRNVTRDGQAIRINGEVVFQRLVLDQGYYPDGILTAPSDEALVRDIELSMAAGFNGARLHQKVFEERFLYHADRLGYLVWGEFADWGIDRANPAANVIAQWLEILDRDVSHPAIVGWCPLNETAEAIGDEISRLDDLVRGMYLACKTVDPTRPALDSSGYSHRAPDLDVYDCHDYTGNPAEFAAHHARTAEGAVFYDHGDGPAWSVPYRGQPFFVSEFGGIWWNPEAAEGEDSWGYGGRPKTIEEFYERFAGLCDAQLDNPGLFGYCYTQLTDCFQEQNGILFFDRRPKFDLERLHAVQARQAAIELKE